MFTCILDALSQYHVDIPNAAEKSIVYNRSEAFITFDLTLPPEEQSPFTPDLIDLIDQCTPYLRDFRNNEARRTIASETLKQLDRRLKKTLDDLSLVIRASHLENPSYVEQWGFEIKQSTGNVSYPTGRKQRLAVLKTCIEKEQSRPEEDRFKSPHLDSLIELYNEIKATEADRDAGHRGRKKSNEASLELSKQMVDHLRAAGAFLISRRFKFKITRDLEDWGYKVVKRSARTAKEEAEAVEEAASTNGAETTTTNGDLNLNGTGEVVLSVNGESKL